MRREKHNRESVSTEVRPQDYTVPRAAIALLPCEQALHHRVCPISMSETPNGMRVLVLACTDPASLPMLDQVQRLTGCRVQPMKASEQDVLIGIATHYRDVAGPLIADIIPYLEKAAQEMDLHGEAAQSNAADGDEPTARSVLDRIYRRGVNERATDIHLEPHEKSVIVRFRVDGILADHMTYEAVLHPSIVSRIKILANLDISIFRAAQDGRFDVKVGHRIFDVRVSTVPTLWGESVVMRLLPKGQLSLTFGELGLSETCRKELEAMIHQPHGMILLTGPTGSGKTTTLYAALSTIDCVSKKVVTIEDPIEYQFDRVCQMQVNAKGGLTFATGLRSILRQDPDVIMVGEIRDLDTLDMAIHSALTGHLVLSTLHCNDAAAVPSRMVDMGAEPFLVASAVTGLVSQRLLRRICDDCKAPTSISETARRRLGLPMGTVYYQGRGCERCHGTGYYGRISVFEVVPLREELQQATIRNASANEMRQIIRTLGYQTLRDDGAAKAQAGLTTVEEMMRAIYMPE